VATRSPSWFDIYDVDELEFVLDLNDFAFRDRSCEGADNGVYLLRVEGIPRFFAELRFDRRP
jgi:hypothetical protein